MRRRSALSLLLIVGVPTSLFLSPAARATSDDAAQAPGPLAPAQVPEPLKPWISWALRGHEEELCPRASGDESGDAEPTCLWPSRLSLQLDAHGGTFSQGVRLYREAMVPLPGDSTAWPRELRVDGQPAPVVEEASGPVAWLKPGEHQLAGSFAWTKLPESLHVPQATGLIALTLRGRAALAEPRRGRAALAAEGRGGRAGREPPRGARLAAADRRDRAARRHPFGSPWCRGRTARRCSGARCSRASRPSRSRARCRRGSSPTAACACRCGRAPSASTWSRGRSGPVESLALPQDAQGPWSAEELWTFSARPDLRVAEVLRWCPID